MLSVRIALFLSLTSCCSLAVWGKVLGVSFDALTLHRAGFPFNLHCVCMTSIAHCAFLFEVEIRMVLAAYA